MGYFAKQYYQQNCFHILLERNQMGALPRQFHLQDVPWTDSDKPVHLSTSMQVIATQHHIIRPRGFLDFIADMFCRSASQG